MSIPHALSEQIHGLLRSPYRSQSDVATEIHAFGKEAIPVIVESLSDPELQDSSVVALTLFGADAAVAAPVAAAIVKSFRQSWNDWKPFAELFNAIGQAAAAPLLEGLATADEKQLDNLRELAREMDPSILLPRLYELLRVADPVVRKGACRVISAFVSREELDLTEPLFERLHDDVVSVRNAAAAALSWSTKLGKLREAASHGDELTRAGCVKALTKSSEFLNTGDMKFFRDLTSDESPLVSVCAVDGLLLTANGISERAISSALKSPDPNTCIAALHVIRTHRLRVYDRHLMDLAFDQARDISVQREAALTLLSMPCQQPSVQRRIHKLLIVGLQDRNDRSRLHYLYDLPAGPQSSPLVPAVLACLRDSDQDVALAAARALGKIGDSRGEVIEALSGVLDLPDEHLRVAAMLALGTIGPGAVGCLPKLLELLKRNEMTIETLRTIEVFGPAAAEAVPDVARLIGRRTEFAPYALAAIGTREAILALGKSIDSWGNGDRKDFESTVGALADIPDEAREVFVSEFPSAQPGEFGPLISGLAEVISDEQLVPYLVTALERGNDKDRFSATTLLTSCLRNLSDHEQHFIQVPGAVDQLAQRLKDAGRYESKYVLDAFDLLNERNGRLTKFYRNDLIRCARRTLTEATDDYERSSIREIAGRLGLPIELGND